jgi:hypothetical protein
VTGATGAEEATLGDGAGEGVDEGGHVAHYNVTVLEVRTASALDALMVNPATRALIWTRIDATTALVDPDRTRLLLARLRAAGHAPRLSSPVVQP